MQSGMRLEAGMTGLAIQSRTAYLQHVDEDLRSDIAALSSQSIEPGTES